MKVLIVLNPAAGQEEHSSVREALVRGLGESQIQYEIHETGSVSQEVSSRPAPVGG